MAPPIKNISLCILYYNSWCDDIIIILFICIITFISLSDVKCQSILSDDQYIAYRYYFNGNSNGNILNFPAPLSDGMIVFAG